MGCETCPKTEFNPTLLFQLGTGVYLMTSNSVGKNFRSSLNMKNLVVIKNILRDI